MDLLMRHMTDFFRDIHTLLELLSLADLVRYLVTLFPINIVTLLLRNIFADWVCNQLLMSLLHVLALIIGVLLAGGLDGCPHLVVPLDHPLVLTVFLVESDTLSLSVRFIHSLVLINTDLLVDSLTHLVLHSLALLHHLHLVLCVPDSGVVGHTHNFWLLLYDLCRLWLGSGWCWGRSSILR